MANCKDQVERWYDGITRYQWLVLVIASLGWIFDVFEGQIFVASMREAMPSLVAEDPSGKTIAHEETTGDEEDKEKSPEDTRQGKIALYNNIALGAFLLGGALGGILFGMVSDRIGRTKTMQLTILFYSLFTCLSAFSQQWWHLAAFRFLVAMGVGGEWAVASSMVAEVFPDRARAHVGGIFHGSSVLGGILAVLAGFFLIGNPAVQAYAEQVEMPSLPWRLGFGLGVLPALLIIWIRLSLREPESWQAARQRAAKAPEQRMGSISDLFRGAYLRRTLVGVTLAGAGLATFWGTNIYGKNVLLSAAERQILARESVGQAETQDDDTKKMILADHQIQLKRWEMLGMLLVTIGGGVGLVCFGPICERLGRRPAFLVYHLGGLISAVIVFQFLEGITVTVLALPLFGFLTVGMHAGYAIYFPELYPTRLRGTGTGFCFNAGRILAAPILFANGWLQKDWGYSLNDTATLLSLLFLVGVVVLIFAPETKQQKLPD